MEIENKLYKIYNSINNITSKKPLKDKNEVETETSKSNNTELISFSNEDKLKLILSSLKIPVSEKNISIAKILLKNNFQINENNFKDLNKTIKSFENNPLEKVDFILKNKLPLEETTLSQLEEHISKNINLKNDIKDLVSFFKDKKIFSEIIKTSLPLKNDILENLHKNLENIKNTLNFKKSEKLAQEILENIKSFMFSSIKKDKSSILSLNEENFNSNIEKFLLNKSDSLIDEIFKMPNTDEKIINIKDFLENIKNNNLIKFFLTKEDSKNILENNLIDKIIPEDILFDSTKLKNFTNLIKSIFENKNVNKNLNEFEARSLFKNIETILLKNIFEPVKQKDFKDLLKKISDFQNEVKSTFYLNPKNLNKKEINEFYNNIKEIVKTAKNIVSEKQLENSEKILENFENIEKNIEFMNNIKEPNFLQIPLVLNNFETNCELYVFEEKNKKNNNSNSASAILCLDLSNLGHLEVYINKINSNITCQFKVENKNIENLVKENVKTLKSYLSAKNLNLKEILFKKDTENFTLISKNINEKSYNSYNLEKFDIKT